MQYVEMLFLLVAWHFIADYPLQGDFLAKAKNKYAPLPGVPWYQALLAHSFIHAVGVYAITEVLWLALVELAVHALVDNAKCAKAISFNEDQFVHFVCKVLYVVGVSNI